MAAVGQPAELRQILDRLRDGASRARMPR
jgi:hypothetical protein